MRFSIVSFSVLCFLAQACADDSPAGGSGPAGGSSPGGSAGDGGSTKGGGGEAGSVAGGGGSDGGAGGEPPGCGTETETCHNTIDDDADGAECAIWQRVYGDLDQQIPLAPSVTPAGEVYFSGSLTSLGDPASIEFAGETLTSNDVELSFLAKLGPQGEELWAKLLPGVTAIAARPDGGVVVASFFSVAGYDFGGGTLSGPDWNTAIVAYDGDGQHVWSTAFSATDETVFGRVAVGPSGEVLVSGYFLGEATIGEDVYEANGGTHDLVLVKIDPSGEIAWSKVVGGELASMYGAEVAVGAQGDVTYSGNFRGDLSFGGAVLTQGPAGPSFLARYDTNGNHLWSQKACTNCAVNSIAVDEAGDVALTGMFADGSAFGRVQLVSAGSLDVFVAKVAADQEPLWAIRFGDEQLQEGSSIATTCGGDLIAALGFSGTLQLGDQELAASVEHDLAIMKLSPTGEVLWARKPATTASFGPDCDVAGQASGEAVLACLVSGTHDFGAGPLAAAGAPAGQGDVAIVKLAR